LHTASPGQSKTVRVNVRMNSQLQLCSQQQPRKPETQTGAHIAHLYYSKLQRCNYVQTCHKAIEVKPTCASVQVDVHSQRMRRVERAPGLTRKRDYKETRTCTQALEHSMTVATKALRTNASYAQACESTAAACSTRGARDCAAPSHRTCPQQSNAISSSSQA
jgi:hypothetical protein